ncbi:hypothetical protein NUW54_g3102 [Trametes sanguinea]|uniref:Uncharacterized protein n=1 Tax=Trametes sanguinea TaxID=158606 RepID=A0ACC1Q496_9APHY|nr:hypothetical protein NUW54_g3102 [Trametes sanguinea]
MTAHLLAGFSGDHAADQIKTAKDLEAWKRDTTYLVLGRDSLGIGSEPSAPVSAELSKLLKVSAEDVVVAAGGNLPWLSLSSEEQVARYTERLREAVADVGKQLFDLLPEEEQKLLSLFLRLGCAMHKDLNSVKGGNTAMMAAWADLGTTPPVLLANKENASALRDVDTEALALLLTSSELSGEGLSDAEMRALESSTRGGVKLTSLAGALFNNKDDKKGQQDTYAFYFEEVVGQPLRFPDTSNTRYQTHCCAAAELLVHRSHYIHFLEVIRDRKDRAVFSHMEENVYAGLQDVPTLTELAAMTLYAQAITHPYMRVARIHQNGLKLGSLHDKLKAHVSRVISNPEILCAPAATSELGAMDGLEWERPEAVAVVHEMAPDLPHLQDILVAFFPMRPTDSAEEDTAGCDGPSDESTKNATLSLSGWAWE